MGDMRNVSRVQIMLLCIHIHQPHSKFFHQLFDQFQRIVIAAFYIAKHHRLLCEKVCAPLLPDRSNSVPAIGCAATNRPLRG